MSARVMAVARWLCGRFMSRVCVARRTTQKTAGKGVPNVGGVVFERHAPLNCWRRSYRGRHIGEALRATLALNEVDWMNVNARILKLRMDGIRALAQAHRSEEIPVCLYRAFFTLLSGDAK